MLGNSLNYPHLQENTTLTETPTVHVTVAPAPSCVCGVDIDDVEYYGPETTTLRALNKGKFGYFVHIYSSNRCCKLLHVEHTEREFVINTFSRLVIFTFLENSCNEIESVTLLQGIVVSVPRSRCSLELRVDKSMSSHSLLKIHPCVASPWRNRRKRARSTGMCSTTTLLQRGLRSSTSFPTQSPFPPIHRQGHNSFLCPRVALVGPTANP